MKITIGTRIVDNENTLHAVRTASGWMSSFPEETFSSSDCAAFDAIARGETNEWPPSELNGNRAWVGMKAVAELESVRLARDFQRERFEALEGLLNKAIETLGTVKGRAEVDHRGVGAVRMLIQKSIESLGVVRAEALSPTRAA